MPAGYCPACRTRKLATVAAGKHSFLKCDGCGGAAFTVAVLCTLIQSRHALTVAEHAKTAPAGKRACPSCAAPMSVVNETNRVGTYELDACAKCLVVWFDRGEFESAPRNPETPSLEQLRQRSRKAAATARVVFDPDNTTGDVFDLILGILNLLD